MSSTKFTSNRRFPTPLDVTDDPRSHTLALQQIIEALSIGQRRTRDIANSFVRLSELEDMGLIEIVGNRFNIIPIDGGTTTTVPSALDDLTDVNVPSPADGDSLVWDSGTSMWVAAAVGGSTFQSTDLYGSSINDLSDVGTGTPADGDVLTYDHATRMWVASTPVVTPAFTPSDLYDASLNDLSDVGFTTAPANGDVLTYDTSIHRWKSSAPAPVYFALDSITDVTAPTPADNDVLSWDTATSRWINASFSAVIGGLNDLSDVTTPYPSAGDILMWDGYSWTNQKLEITHPDTPPTVANSLDDEFDGPLNLTTKWTVESGTYTADLRTVDGYLVVDPTATQVIWISQPISGSNWAVEIGLVGFKGNFTGNSTQCQLAAYRGTNQVVMGHVRNGAGTSRFSVDRWTNFAYTSTPSTSSYGVQQLEMWMPHYLRLVYSGGTLYMDRSFYPVDGRNAKLASSTNSWVNLLSETAATHLGGDPTRVGLFFTARSTGIPFILKYFRRIG